MLGSRYSLEQKFIDDDDDGREVVDGTGNTAREITLNLKYSIYLHSYFY